MEATPSQTISAIVLLVVMVPVCARQLPAWWSGRSTISAEVPPTSWPWSVGLWRRVAHGLVTSVVMLIVGAAAVLASSFNETASTALTIIAAILAGLWGVQLLFARPRFLIPPPWRPE
jgi:hypothetical protein